MLGPGARRVAPLVALAAALGIARSAHGFCRTMSCGKDCDVDPDTQCAIGTPVAWPQYCVSYSLQYQASQKVDLQTATSIAEKAFGAWQEVSCPSGGPPSIVLDHPFGPVACAAHEYNQADGNANIILFHDDAWPYSSQGDILALTTVTYSKKTGDIYDVDMEINGNQILSTTEVVDPIGFDLQSIMTHEAGHFLGLAHSHDPDATMWAQYSAGTDGFRDLADDDIAGICAVYPPATVNNVCDFTPRQGFSPECGIFPSGSATCSLSARGLRRASGGMEAAAALVVAGLFASARRRKGRR